MEETKPSALLRWPYTSSVSGQYKIDKILAKIKFKNNVNIIKNIKNYYGTETEIYKKKFDKYKTYVYIAQITEIVLSSTATTEKTKSMAITGIGIPYSIPAAFATATLCGS